MAICSLEVSRHATQESISKTHGLVIGGRQAVAIMMKMMATLWMNCILKRREQLSPVSPGSLFQWTRSSLEIVQSLEALNSSHLILLLGYAEKTYESGETL